MIKDLKVDTVSLVKNPANDQSFLALRKAVDDSPISVAYEALQSIIAASEELNLSPEDILMIQASLEFLKSLERDQNQDEIPIAPYPLPNLAKESLEIIKIQQFQEAGQRHSDENFALIDRIIELLKRLRGKSPKEIAAEQEHDFNNGTKLSLLGYQGQTEVPLTKRRFSFQESRILSALNTEGSEWDICIIESGYSKNGVYANGSFIPRYYPLTTLQNATRLFEGARVYVYARPYDGRLIGDHLSDADIKANPNGYAKDLVGFIKNPRITGTILVGTLHILEGCDWLRRNLKDAFDQKQENVYNLSIDSDGAQRLGQINGKPALIVESLSRVSSVDVVTYPAAGGRFLRLVASLKPEELDKMDKELLDKVNQFEMRQLLRGALMESRLPVLVQAKIRKNFLAKDEIDIDQLEIAIREAKLQMDAEDEEVAVKKAKKDEEYPYPMPKKKMKHGMDDEEDVKPDEEEEYPMPTKKAKGTMVKKAGDRWVVFVDGKIAANKATEEEANAFAKEKGGMKESSAQWLDKRFEAMAQALDEKIENQTKLTESINYLNTTVLDSGLSTKAQQKLFKQFQGRIFESSDLDTEIEFLREISTAGDRSGDVNLPGQVREVRCTESEWDKLTTGLDGFWANENLKGKDGSPIRQMRSLQEAYTLITKKPWDVQNFMKEAFGQERYDSHGRYGTQVGRMTEALSTTSWSLILGDSITRRLLAEYNVPSLQTWRQICSEIGNVKDFRQQRRMRTGGYGVLPVVAQNDSYTYLTSPTDEEARYTIAKKGGLESITLEMMANDDVGAIRRIPRRLGRAAAQTLYRGVFDIFDLNSSLNWSSDSTALFTAAHANLGTVALDADGLNASIVRMKKQTAFGDTNEVLGLVPKFILYPPDLDRTVHKLLHTTPQEPFSADHDANPFLKYNIQPIEVFYWTDTNDFFLVADPADIPTLEVGFFNGNEDPELFVSDQDNIAGSSMFNADKLTYKIRHVWGIGILETRGFDGNQVT